MESIVLKFLEAKSLKSVLDRMVTEYGTASVNEKNNSVIVCDTPENLAKIMMEVKKADQTPRQILIEVVILDAQLRDDAEIGVNWDLLSHDTYDVVYRQNLTNERLRSTRSDDETIGNATVFNTVGAGGDLSLISGTIRHVLHAIQQKRDVEILASPTTLVVLTGDAGNPAAAADPGSTAGKVLRIEQPTTIGQAAPTTALSGMGAGGGLCIDHVDGSLYVTDRTPSGDRLQRITKDSRVSTVWTWPDKPGVAGCAAMDGIVLVNLVNTKQTVAVRLAAGTGSVTSEPEVMRQDTHGHVWAVKMSPDGNVWGATVNKTAGDAEKLDDVVFPLFPSGGGFPRANDDKD